MKERVDTFREHERRLYGIAYRMLSSRADAEDMVQEAYVRWHRVDVEHIRSPEAWLVTAVTRLCIDRLRLVRAEREAYIGPWLPEPLAADSSPPADAASELASDLSIAFLVVLERLAPEERAAFLLHEVFDSDYDDIAKVLGKSEVACRQLVSRARQRVRQEKPRFKVSEDARVRLLERFIDALRAQDHAAVLSLFAQDATWTSDGGGKARAAKKVVRGAELVSRFTLGIWRRYLDTTTPMLATMNGEIGLVFYAGGQLVSATAFVTDGRRIIAGLAMVNPDKLKSFVPSDARPLSGGAREQLH